MAEPLPKTCYRWGCPNLANALDRAYVDAQLQGCRANCRRRPATFLQGLLCLFAIVLRQASMVCPELVGNAVPLAVSSQQVREDFDLLPTVREYQIIGATQDFVELRGHLDNAALKQRPPS